MHSKKESYVRGKLAFSRTKVLLIDREQEYFIKPFSVDRGYLEGDIVEAKVVRGGSEGYLAEVIVKKLIQRTRLPIIGTVGNIQGRKMRVEIFREYGNIGSITVFSEKGDESIDDIIELRAIEPKGWKVGEILGKSGDEKIDEILIYRKEGVRLEFPEKVLEAGEKIERGTLGKKNNKTLIPPYIRDGLMGEYFDDEKNPFPSTTLTYEEGGSRERTDFRNWFTMTIDGADAKDLDDAISIARYNDGNYLIGVHIADVAEYVREETDIDHEAILRTTSIYTPGRVIPMLPEILSNDLCSLHPGEPKLTLSILMKLDKRGEVLATFMTEGIIESRKRGIYEEIVDEIQDSRFKIQRGEQENGENQGNGESEGSTLSERGGKEGTDERQQSESEFVDPSGAFGTFHSGKVQVLESTENDTRDSRQARMTGILNSASSSEGHKNSGEIPHLSDFFSLFHILEKRRKKEGKIIFESSEPKFSIDTEGKIIDIYQRDRGASHMMIEEFMVLANEEVAKWCMKHSLPFLSRIHHLPPEENAKIIREIVGLTSGDIHPTHIRQFLDTLSTGPLEKNKQINNKGGGQKNRETEGGKLSESDENQKTDGRSERVFSPLGTFGTFSHESTGTVSGKVQTHESTETGSIDSGSSPGMTGKRDSGMNQDIQATSLYKYSRLLLPKMAKAFYSDKAHMHFGLALEYYSHFTSPIRRYPDLQIHRIIKEELHKTLDKKRKEHYRHMLKKIAKKCSDGEVRATDIERTIDALYICRYMMDRVGGVYTGRVSGLTEWAVFIELEMGVDVTVYLSKGRDKGRYTYDPVRGTLALGQKIVHTIGDVRRVKIIGVNMDDRRVEGEILQ